MGIWWKEKVRELRERCGSSGERRGSGAKGVGVWRTVHRVAEKVRRWEKMYGDGRKGRKSAKGGSRWREIGI